MAVGEWHPTGNPPGNSLIKRTPLEEYLNTDEVGTTNGPFSRQPLLEGQYTYTFQAVTTATLCGILDYLHPRQLRPVNVTPCKPEWHIHYGMNVRAPEAPTEIILNIPIDMYEAFVPAGVAAASVSARLGRSITVVYDNQPKECVGGACVQLDDTFQPPPLGNACADIDYGTPMSTGVLSGKSTIRVDATKWTTAHPDRLALILAHELMHYFGLENRETTGCAATNTLIGPIVGGCYSSSPLLGGQILGPSDTDVAAVVEGSYGRKERRICGW